MLDGLASLHSSGIEVIAFGDLFLADVRSYRERLVARSALRPAFPLWGKPTAELARQFTGCGFRAVLVCVDPRQIDVSHCGSEFDAALLRALPPTADPCGENGEFHTFVYDGPMFGAPIPTQRGLVVERDGFVFCDLLPSDPLGATS
jgi:diphthamide synthase (EF-2-diphthine--ammonia ligase)